MFLTHLDVRAVSEGKWQLLAPLDYQVYEGEWFEDCVIRVPVEFVTDLASIPRILRGVFVQNDSHRRAAVLHDYLYARKGKLDTTNHTRKECDQLFLRAMVDCEVGWLKSRLMYQGVRLGGWVIFNRKDHTTQG